MGKAHVPESPCEGSGTRFCQRGASALLLHLTEPQFPHLQTGFSKDRPGSAWHGPWHQVSAGHLVVIVSAVTTNYGHGCW